MTTTATPSPVPAADGVIEDPRRRRAVLIAVCIALMAVIASVSGLNVAQQEFAVAFGASQSTVLWIINGYTLTLAALLLPLGAIGDRVGRRPVLLAGLALFGAASAVSGFATSTEVMIGSRLLAGFAAAMIMPVTLAVITSTFPDEERSQAIGVWSGVAGAGGLLGMIVSAALIDVVSWRWLFALPAALVAVAFVLSARAVPDSRERPDEPFDTGGAALSVVAVVGAVFALHEGPERGWSDPLLLASVVAAVAGLAAFLWWEMRQSAPLLDIRLFRDRRLAGGSVTLLSVFGVLGGIFVVLYPYFQAVLGWSGLRSTAGLLPMALAMMTVSALAPKVAKAIGARATTLTGIAVATAGLAGMAAFVSVDGGYLSVLPGMLVIGVGVGLTMPPATEAITSALPRSQQGVASALNDVTRELGTALGVALLGAVVAAGYQGSISGRLDGVPDGVAAAAEDGIATALQAAGEAGPQAGIVVRAAQEAFVDGWQRSMWTGVAAMAVLFAYLLARGPRHVAAGDRPGESETAEPAAPPVVPVP
jgi:EmrB/QacA subfamily drug resistance transporter